MFNASRRNASGLVVAGVIGLGTFGAQAAIISIGTGSNQQGRINDSFSKPGSISEGRTIRAGTTGGDAVFRGFMIFNTSSVVGSLDSATLTYELSAPAGSPGNYEVYGVSTDAGFDGAVDSLAERTAVYQAPGGSNATLISTLGPGAGVVNLDVTSFVESERTGGNNIVGFVFVEVSPSIDGSADLIQFFDGNDPGVQNPQLDLQLVPEPSSLALLGLGALACVRRRRNS